MFLFLWFSLSFLLLLMLLLFLFLSGSFLSFCRSSCGALHCLLCQCLIVGFVTSASCVLISFCALFCYLSSSLSVCPC